MHPSPTLVASTVVVAILATAAVWMIDVRAWLRMPATVVVAIYAAWATLRLARPRVASLVWSGDGGALVRLRSTGAGGGDDVLGAVQDARAMGPLIVLTLRWPPRECAHLWILPDNLDADTRRRLRMRVGRGGRPHAASGNADSR